MPQAHILLWLDSADKLDNVDVIDSVICAEFPDPKRYPKLFDVVSALMVHGPCGHARKGSPCMRDGKCSKYFPKKFVEKSSFDSDGYPIYKRRNSGVSIVRKGIELDNRFIVPYNPKLLMKYKAHINIEYCNKSNSIKYLFKYVNKGVDRVTVSMGVENSGNAENEVVDEIQQYYDYRYLCPCEFVWKIFKFDIHHRWPPVQRLNFHLPQQLVFFKDCDMIDNVVAQSRDKKTPFLAWIKANSKFDMGKSLTYGEFSTKFIYDVGLQEWRPRRRGFSIGRVKFAPPGSGEVYYLRLLLNVQKECTSYESVCIVDEVVHPTFRDACNAFGLLTDDKEFVDGIIETSVLASGMYLRRLFVNLLLSNSMSKPASVWEKTWGILSDGILYDKRRALNCPDLQIEEKTLQSLCLVEIEKLLLANGKSLKDFETMSYPASDELNEFGNILIFNELSHDVVEMAEKHAEHV